MPLLERALPRPERERFREATAEALVDALYADSRATLVWFAVCLVLLETIIGEVVRDVPLARGVYVALFVVTAARFALVGVWARRRGRFGTTRARHVAFGFGALLTGLGLGAINVLSLVRLDAVRCGLLTIAETGVTAVALTSLGASPIVYGLFALPNLLGMLAVVALGGASTDNRALTWMIVVYLGALSAMLLQQYVTRRDNIVLRLAMAELALVDSLTSLRNRRYLNDFMDGETKRVSRAERRGKVGPSAALLVIDIDHFKHINDQHGHDAGDAVLRAVADALVETVRKADLAVRWGGEEFVVVSRDLAAQDAMGLADRIRRRIAETPFVLPSGERVTLTCSVGMSVFPFRPQGSAPLPWDEALLLADAGLYRAKKTGRNRTVALLEGTERWEAGREQIEAIRADPALAATRGLIELLASPEPPLPLPLRRRTTRGRPPRAPRGQPGRAPTPPRRARRGRRPRRDRSKT